VPIIVSFIGGRNVLGVVNFLHLLSANMGTELLFWKSNSFGLKMILREKEHF